MPEIVLKAQNVSKQYRLGLIGTGTITQDINRWWCKFMGKEDPFLKIGETNDIGVMGKSQFIWALKDLNFEISKGEVLGIIGNNGAGKSTLLKILSKVTAPTAGSIKYNGRIASLLEVGTGFHNEMTGRENIFLNGTILGMTKSEIKSKFDNIADFSGCGRYIDTPAKRYSSGMFVRVAFSIAAHLEPDILIIDEVLAVADAEFQAKAVNKIKSISEKSGVTVIFVSHSMKMIESLCDRVILMDKGGIIFEGETKDAVRKYLEAKEKRENMDEIKIED